MAVRYTDVDLMLLKRWGEVTALREAFDELLGRMNSVMETALQQAMTHLNENGLVGYVDAKEPSLSFWKPHWVNKKDDGIYGKIVGFAPDECARVALPHPAVFLMAEDLPSLRIVESVEQFGKAFRATLTEEQRAAWNFDIELDVNPVGREYADISDMDRVRLASDADALANFLRQCIDEFMELVPVIDATLARMTRK